MDELAKGLVIAAVSIALGYAAVLLFWRVRSAIQLRRAEDQPLHSTRAVIWRDPGEVERLDLAEGPGGEHGAPAAPFTFVEEHFTGSRPCVSVRDRRGRTWRVKWGDEVQVETLATRLAWAAGYFVETTYFVAAGRVDGAPALKKASSCVDTEGRFKDARFELDEDNVMKHFDEHSWAWHDNPFIGTRELNGLKIVMMWVSNWDAKDVRDVARGSNTAIFEHLIPSGLARRSGSREGGQREARYLIIDWGGALGKWGNVVNRGRWDPHGFSEQTPEFVQGVDAGFLRWGYTGQRTADIVEGIRVSDAEWLLGYLGRLHHRQIVEAVGASGGSVEEAEAFAVALLARLDRLRETVSNPSASPSPVPSVAAG